MLLTKRMSYCLITLSALVKKKWCGSFYSFCHRQPSVNMSVPQLVSRQFPRCMYMAMNFGVIVDIPFVCPGLLV